MAKTAQVNINWMGKPEGIAGCCHIVSEPACIDPPHKRTKFFFDLPKSSGGQVVSCNIFRTENQWGRALNPPIEVSQKLFRLLNSLRHYYTLKVQPRNSRGSGEKLKIEISGNQTKGAIITYPSW